MKTVLLVGFPNSGKSTIFNLLSGKSRKVSNYSGISVDSDIAELKSNLNYSDEEKIQIVDLPGIYSLLPSSIDEGVTVGTILNLNNTLRGYDEIIVIIDSAKLEANFSLALAIKEIVGNRVSLIINKTDLFHKNNISWEKVEKLTGLKIYSCSTFNNTEKIASNIDSFIREQIKTSEKNIKPIQKLQVTQKSFDFIPFKTNDFSNVDIVETEDIVLKKIKNHQIEARKILKEFDEYNKIYASQITYKIDKVLLHPFWGIFFFFGIFFFIFQSLYTFSIPLMNLIEFAIRKTGNFLNPFVTNEMLNSLIFDGIFAGVGGVLVFLPQIAILFFLLNILEQSGYISRAAFITDKFMSIFGLNGKAFLPFLSGFACSVPAIMATRTIPDKGERLATIMVLPLITCSGRLPVYIFLIGTFVPSQTFGGIFNTQALALFFMYFLGSIVALIMAKIFRLSFFKSKTKSFFMEMPVYQKPQLKFAFSQMSFQSKIFLKKAGTIIFALSIIIWLLSVFPSTNPTLLENKTKEEIASIKLENSAIGTFGKAIEPVIKPLGYDWKIGIGIITAFGARELFISGLGTIYALGDVDEESKSLRERLHSEKDQITGKPIFNIAVVCSLLIFFAFACQCISSLVIVKYEAGLKWSILMFIYMLVIAYVGAFVTYNLVNKLIT